MKWFIIMVWNSLTSINDHITSHQILPSGILSFPISVKPFCAAARQIEKDSYQLREAGFVNSSGCCRRNWQHWGRNWTEQRRWKWPVQQMRFLWRRSGIIRSASVHAFNSCANHDVIITVHECKCNNTIEMLLDVLRRIWLGVQNLIFNSPLFQILSKFRDSQSDIN